MSAKAPAKQVKNGAGETPPIVKHESLAEALLAVQREVPAVEPDSVNPHFKSRFVSLGNLISKVRPVLNRHGVSFQQFPSTTEDGKPALTTILRHESGDSESYTAPLMPTKADPQAQGSAITYMRRYALAAALGVCDQEDDDGQAASGSGAPAAQPEPRPQQETEADHEAALEALLSQDGKLQAKRKLADDGMKRLGAGTQQRLRELQQATTEKALDQLLVRIDNALGSGEGDAEEGSS